MEQAGGKEMANNHEPMIRLETNGMAPVLSYNVPEPTSYSGRNFIDLQLPANYFVQPAVKVGHGGGRMQVARAVLPGQRPHAVRAGRDVAHETEVQIAAGMTAPGSEGFAPALRHIDPDEVQAMAQAGKRLNVYRSLYGTLTYNYIDAEVAPAPTGAVVALRPRASGRRANWMISSSRRWLKRFCR
jgi:hypothetical protein